MSLQNWFGITEVGFGPLCGCEPSKRRQSETQGTHRHKVYGFNFKWIGLMYCRWWYGHKWYAWLHIKIGRPFF